MISVQAFVTFSLAMINQQEWLRTRKNLLDQVKFQVELRLGRPSRALRQYAKSLDLEFKNGWKACGETDFVRALARARVLLSGDFHAYAQSQRAHLRILRDLVPHQRIQLALECLPANAGPAIRSYLSGKMSEKKFLQEVDWDRSWGFPWEHYRPLMELARDRGIEVTGLNSRISAGLAQRDQQMAQIISRLRREDPEALVYVVVGEWHLAHSHLPRRLRVGLKDHELMVLFQDVEQLYFRLAKAQSEGVTDYLKGAGNRFCVMFSPPWMKWQSYLMYLEHAYDRDLQEDLAIDYSDHVASLVEVLEKDVKVATTRSRLQVYCSNSRTSLARLKVSLPKRFGKILLYHLEHDLSFLLPEKDWLYLSRPTINHASALAGQFIHAQLAERKRTLWDLPQDFVALIWVEAVGFFFSKWINPKRKAENWDSLRLRLEATSPKDKGRMALLLALDHRLSEVVWVQTGRMRRSRYKVRDTGAYVEASRLAGNQLGERLFQKVRSKDISLQQLMTYLKVNVEGPEFAKMYWNLIRRIESGAQ